MATYTFWGNIHEETCGVSSLKVASGEIAIGESGDITPEEYASLSEICVLVPGTLGWSRHNFPWQLPDSVRVVISAPPVISSIPVLSGTAQQGSVLSSSHGVWSNSPTSYAYQWQTSTNGTSGWTNIGGATSNSYTCQVGDVNNYLRCRVTASNSIGAGTPSNSSADGPVTAADTTVKSIFADAESSSLSATGGAGPLSVGTAFYVGPIGGSGTRQLVGVRFWNPLGAPISATWTAYVYEANGTDFTTGTLLGSKSVSSMSEAAWNSITFDTPIAINKLTVAGGTGYYAVMIQLPADSGGLWNSAGNVHYGANAHRFGSGEIVSSADSNLVAAAGTDTTPHNGLFSDTSAVTPAPSGSFNDTFYGVDPLII